MFCFVKGEIMTNKKVFIYELMLLLAAFVWGLSFVAQDIGADIVPPFSFNGIRSLIGSVVLLPLIFFMDLKMPEEKVIGWNKETIIGGFLCGLALFAATTFQQIGIMSTSAGKSGFITSFYIVVVPFLSVFLKKKIKLNSWISALIACVGLYFLSIQGEFRINKGDIYTFFCAIFFAMQIILIDKFASKTNCVKLSAFQFLTVGILSLPVLFFVEKPTIEMINEAKYALLYMGVMSCGVAYTLQTVAQKYVKPEISSLLMSFEAVFAGLMGWLLLDNQFTPNQILGCILMFAAVIISTVLPELKVKKKL